LCSVHFQRKTQRNCNVRRRENRSKIAPIKGIKSYRGTTVISGKRTIHGTEEEWQVLIEHYGGNPLALKMVAAGTQELFNGKIAPVLQYVEQGIVIFEDIATC
jgi:hypothetical protein